jgi:hypothetical protein
MRNKKLFLIILAAGISILWASQVLSFNRGMHRDLNERIAQRVINNFSLNDYLINQLGFAQGVMQILPKDSDKFRVFEWLGEGGDKEDEPEALYRYPTNTARNNRHFHDPLESWNNAGLRTPIFTAQSSLMWAQNQNQDVGGKWSWHDARDYFYEGLIATDKTVRDSFFAKAFRALGQLMHLIQDASVPSHTRNDIHAIYHYESWVEDVRNNWSAKYDSWISTPKTYDRSILDFPPNPLAPNPIAKIMDTDRYTRDNQDIESTKSLAIGLAEYSNGNFFSEDTCFVGWYPFPNWACVETVPYPIVDPRDPLRTVSRQYYKKDPTVACGETNEGKGYRLATVGFLKDYVLRYFPLYAQTLRGLEKPALDANVYGDYAPLLMPRAVGYSAGLLEYFFRGKLQVTAVPVFNKNMIIYLRAKIKNLTPNETMKQGTFTLTYSYRPTGGNPDGSEDIWAQTPAVVSGTLEYGGDEQHPVEDTVIDFLLPTPIPKENYDSAKFTLAFWGTLGNEVGAVIGKTLTLGEIKFKEEWDNGFTGNNNWGHVEYNVFGWNPSNGTTSNTIVGDTLIKENNRYMGSMSDRVNESFVDYDYNNGEFRDGLPILITEDTYLQFKIDAMSINQIPPAPPGYSNHWQALILHFNNALSLQYFQAGQGMYTGPNTAYLTFQLGLIIVDNIYDVFKGSGITVPEGPLNLEGISFLQQLWMLDEPSTVYRRQHMEIDSIRIIEGKKQ